MDATYLDGAEVDEEVGGAVLWGDEAVALLVVEPLDGAVLALGGGVHFDEMWCVGGWWLGGWYLCMEVLLLVSVMGERRVEVAWPCFSLLVRRVELP